MSGDLCKCICGAGHGDSPFVLRVPHALTLAEERGAVCVADRERGRAACFRADNGSYVASYSSWLIGGRLFSIAYSPARGETDVLMPSFPTYQIEISLFI